MLRGICRMRPIGLGRCAGGTTARARGVGYRPSLYPFGLELAVKMKLQCRGLGGIPTVLLPPVVFGGLLIALWTWKCFMMVVFQNKIIYMPGLPPNARREKIEDYTSQCGGIQWREERTVAVDGTQISLCVVSVICGQDATVPAKNVYILYFQGNASSIPPRLPFLSPVLRTLKDRSMIAIQYTIVCCSYRGYWTSRGRPSEDGIAKDAESAMKWIGEMHRNSHGAPHAESAPLIIWGQSIGAGVATSLAARSHLFSENNLVLKTIILETPFISIKAMLETLYPQKWLPYKYLWPFLRNHLDSPRALFKMKENCESNGHSVPKILILEAGNDELVPKEHGDQLQRICFELGLKVERKVVGGALHTEVMVRPQGRLAVVEAIENASE